MAISLLLNLHASAAPPFKIASGVKIAAGVVAVKAAII